MTEPAASIRKFQGKHAALIAVFGICLLLQTIFALNMVQWISAPEVGFNVSSDLSPHTVFSTNQNGYKAGLRAGDWIESINLETFDTHSERRSLITRTLGSINTFHVIRDGQVLEISIPVEKLGVRNVIVKSGLAWLIGLVFSGLGIVVFFMKPYLRSSWTFLGMTLLMGLTIAYYNPSSIYKPGFLEAVGFLTFSFLPATIINLAGSFPQKRAFMTQDAWRRNLPWVFSSILAILSLVALWGQTFATVGSHLRTVQFVYAVIALLTFLGINVHNGLKAPNRTIRYQSLLVITGFTFSLLIPVAINITGFALGVVIVPANVYTPFISMLLLLFPLSIGYAIVKHDLFAIDTIVRRTYGYFLSTGTIVGVYALLVSGLNTAFQAADLSRSPAFSLLFALTVVFTFRPLHERLQALVDRVFYRQHYDYRGTIKGISETMISLFDLEQIRSTLVGTLVEEMFLDGGNILQPAGESGAFKVTFSMGAPVLAGEPRSADSLKKIMIDRTDPLFHHDLEIDPRYEEERDELLSGFTELGSEIMLPMRYKDETHGILSLGPKKSGKMFTAEDVDLLKTVVNQGAVALENARLFEENIEKSRMEEELKIAHNLQMSMLPKAPPDVEGMAFAASCIPAQEVGGDFFDFIDVNTPEGEKKLGIVVADVSGKAVSGALVMAAARSLFRVLSGVTSSTKEIMSIANSRLKQDVTRGMFVALLYAVIDPVKKTITLANAGQTQPVVLSADSKEPVFLENEGDRFPLGIVDGCDYQEARYDLKTGDLIVLYTDGVVEAIDGEGEMYGFERLMQTVGSLRTLNAEDLVNGLVADIMKFVGNTTQHDDITLLVIRVE